MKTKLPGGFAQRSLLFVLAAALAAGAGLFLAQKRFGADPAPGPSATAGLALRTVRLIEPARPLPTFQLIGADGGALGPTQLRGHWTLVFLGFTHCPDVCPTTLASLAQAQKRWEALPEAHRPRLLFVSVDPERDTPQVVGNYARFFHPATLAATGSEQAIADFARNLGLVYMKVPQAGGDYTVDHSATLVLLDPQGRQAGLVRPPLDPKAIAEDLRELSERAP